MNYPWWEYLFGSFSELTAVLCALLALVVLAAALYAWGWRRGASRSLQPSPLAPTSLRPGDRCPYCHAEAAAEVACAQCAARHHEQCWDEHGQCAACGSTSRFGRLERTGGRAPAPRREGRK